MTGVVTSYRRDRLFGFITPEGGGGTDVFFHHDHIIEDVVGRRQVIVGSRVEYLTEIAEGRMQARSIRPLWIAPEQIELETHREESIISRWIPWTHEIGGSGLARRSDGGTVFVSSENVISTGIETLCVGTHIFHGVRPPELGQEFWSATEIEIFQPRASPCEVPSPVPSVSPLLSSQLRNVPLRRIRIRRKQIA